MANTNIQAAKRHPARCLLAALLTLATLWALWEAARWPLFPTRDAAMMFSDEFYQALCCRDYRQAPLAMLTFWMGHQWTALWGETLLNLRRLAWLLVAVSNALGVWWLWRRRGGMLTAAVLFYIASAASLVYCCDNYDWNVGCYPFMVGLALLMLRYWERPGAAVAAGTGAVAALMAMAKVTTAAALPVCVVLIIWHRRAKAWADLGAALAGFAATALLMSTVMCGSPAAYLAAFNSENIISGHTDWLNILDTVKRTFFPVLSTGAPLLMLMLLTPLLSRLAASDRLPAKRFALLRANAGRGWLVVAAVVFGLLTIKEIVLTQYVFGEFYYSPGLLLLPYGAFCLLPWVVKRLRPEAKMPPHASAILWSALLWPWALAIGSDTPLIRLFVMPLMPLAVGVCLSVAPRLTRRWLTVTALVLTIVVGYFRFWQQRDIITSPYDYSRFPGIGAIHCSPTDPIPEYFDLLGRDYTTLTSLFGSDGQVVVSGPGKYFVDYLFTPSTGYALNRFHYPDTWGADLTAALDRSEGNTALDGNEVDTAPYSAATVVMVVDALGSSPTPPPNTTAVKAVEAPYGMLILH